MDVLDAERIERRAQVPDHARTDGKTAVAEYIASEIVDEGRWPTTLTAIEEETEWSRQHIRNTLNDYFRPAVDGTERETETGGDVVRGPDGAIQVRIPGDVDPESYLRGYLARMRQEGEK